MTSPTHWEQTIFFFKNPIEVENGDIIDVDIEITRSCSHRSIDVILSYIVRGKSELIKQRYFFE